MRWFWLCLSTLLLLSAPGRAASPLRLATSGVESSQNYKLAKLLCETYSATNQSAAAPDLPCSLIPTADEWESLAALKSGQADVAIASSNIAGAAFLGKAYADEGKAFAGQPFDSLRVITGLYDMPLFIGAAFQSPATTVHDLVSRRVRFDIPSTASRLAAEQMLTTLSITYDRFTAVLEAPEADIERLVCSEEVDTIWQLTTHRSSLLDAFLNQCGGRFLPLDDALATQFVADHPGYIKTTIAAGSFYRIQYPLDSIAAQMLLVAVQQAEDAPVQRLARSVATQGQLYRRFFPLIDPNAWKRTPGLSSLLMHDAAAETYRKGQ